MNKFMALIQREWLEWRTFWIIVGVIYLLLLGLLAYGSSRVSQEIETHSFSITRDGGEINIEMDEGEGGHNISLSDTSEFLEVWGAIVLGMMEGVNGIIIFLGLFYLTDSLYKERSDQSTFYYRSLPASDLTLLGSKLAFGTVGILSVSFILSSILVLYLHLIFPGAANDLLIATGISISQIQYLDLFGDWFVFHLLELIWLLPFATFLILVSATVKNRPLLISAGIIFLLFLAGVYLNRLYGFDNFILQAIGAPTEAYHAEWSRLPASLNPQSNLELLNGFGHYLLSIRTVVSLLISGLLFWASYVIYRKNIEVS